MWQISNIESTSSNIKFRIKEHGSSISYQNFLEQLKSSKPFRAFYNGLLSDCGFEAFFWENRPVTQQTINEAYECNLINSDFLASRPPDPKTFNSHFRKDKPVASFPNLGKDAQLVVPCPAGSYAVYTHIASFVRNAGDSQLHEFWKQVAIETLALISDDPRWLSTSGLGVFWLHVRIDTYPKYYQTVEYKTP